MDESINDLINKLIVMQNGLKRNRVLVTPYEAKSLTNIVADPGTSTLIRFGICEIRQGNGDEERIGRQITVMGIDIKGYLTLERTFAAVETSDVITCYLIVDNQSNGATFAANEFLDVDQQTSMYKMSNLQRFTILRRQTWVLKSPSGAGISAPIINGDAGAGSTVFGRDTKYFEWMVSIPQVIDYTGVDGDEGEVPGKNIYFCWHSRRGLVAAETVIRTKYIDNN